MAFAKNSALCSKLLPTLIASGQAGSLMCVGDFISQKYIEKSEKWDVVRTLRFGSLGVFFVGPVLKQWYGFLEKRVVLKSPILTTAGKVAADQILMAPAFFTTFLTLNSMVKGNSFETAKNDLKRDFVDILKANYKLWPAVQAINFSVIPPDYRIVFVQSIAIAWNSFLAWKTNK